MVSINMQKKLVKITNMSNQKQNQSDYKIKSKIKKQFKENLLLFFTIFAVIVGIALGFALRKYTNFKPNINQYFGFPGEIFLRMLKFLILPLISSSLICGIASLGAHKASNVASKAFIYYFSTTFLAVILGLALVILIKPGERLKAHNIKETIDPLNNRRVSSVDTMLDLIRNLFPDNLVQMTFTQYESKLVPKYLSTKKKANQSILKQNTTKFFINQTNTNFTADENVIDYWYAVSSERNGINVLGLVMFCFVFGYVISKMNANGKILLSFFEAINDASVKMIGIVMFFSPIGICSLICSAILNMDNPIAVFERISFYMLTVLLGLFTHGFLVLPLIYIIITKKNIFTFAKNMFEALLIALATSSSSATLPVTFKCIEEKNKIPKSISRFVLPVGATINMDGTALYEAVAAIFIAQMNGRDLKLVDYVVTSLTATLASIGAAGVPSAGLVTMVIVLSALNLPQSQISLIYAVDWFLDRFRTFINVWGDSIGAGVVAHLSRENLLDETDVDNSQDLEKSLAFKNEQFIGDSSEANVLEEKESPKSMMTSTSSQTVKIQRGYFVDDSFRGNETTF